MGTTTVHEHLAQAVNPLNQCMCVRLSNCCISHCEYGQREIKMKNAYLYIYTSILVVHKG